METRVKLSLADGPPLLEVKEERGESLWFLLVKRRMRG